MMTILLGKTGFNTEMEKCFENGNLFTHETFHKKSLSIQKKTCCSLEST